jgi:2-polyprenyl-6-methoxyphenol hydroxylase-like FAD-dependent oxidoreductase
MTKHAIISGGSIGGLFAATALLKAGWHVDIYERTEVELSGRGAGIVTHDTLNNALRAVGADLTDLGVQVQDRVAFHKDGSRVATLPYPQIVTSWDRIHQMLRRLVPDGAYHLGKHITGYTQTADDVSALFSNGTTRTADLLVGADGFRSAIRGQMLPDIKPQYVGYVVWRALAHERDLPSDVHSAIFPNFAFFTPSQSQIIGYPIAGQNNDLREGNRRYNFVWYTPAPAELLRDMLTDETGQHHPISIPPPLVRDAVLQDMQERAKATLPAGFVEILSRSERPFFTPIYDHHSPVMHDGRVALSGDAACVARPHVGMGVTKAAEDALCLAKHAATSLETYSQTRVPASLRAHLQARELGSWMLEEDAQNADGSSHVRLTEIMRLTAATVA